MNQQEPSEGRGILRGVAQTRRAMSVAQIRRLDKITRRLSLRFNVSDWTYIEAVARNCRLPVGVVVVGLVETAIHRRTWARPPQGTLPPVATPAGTL